MFTELEKKCKEVYDDIKFILNGGDNIELKDNVKECYGMVEGTCKISINSNGTLMVIDGRVPSKVGGKDYTLYNSIHLDKYFYGDVNRLAEDLAMAYYKTNIENPEFNYTPDFIKYLNSNGRDTQYKKSNNTEMSESVNLTESTMTKDEVINQINEILSDRYPSYDDLRRTLKDAYFYIIHN